MLYQPQLVDPSWHPVFQEAGPDLLSIESKLAQMMGVSDPNQLIANWPFYPPYPYLFRAFHLPLDQVKVVIIGQDPYHNLANDGLPNATGYSFSVRRGTAIPGSLRNIFKELALEYPNFPTMTHGDLQGWVNQGVMLLNANLTVTPGVSGSHKRLWYGLTSKIIKAIVRQNPKVIFMLWGQQAQYFERYIGGNATVLTAAHPSDFSAHKGFFGCNHFLLANQALTKAGFPPIDWSALD